MPNEFFTQLLDAVAGIIVLGIVLTVAEAAVKYIVRVRASSPGRLAYNEVKAIARLLQSETLHVAGAIIEQLPTSTALAVLKRYNVRERRALLQRLTRSGMRREPPYA
jgi:hypothetical protein